MERPPVPYTDLRAIYIVGKGRSGSTLLDNALGELHGVVTLGELYHLWDWGLVSGYACGCGRPVPDCPFWSDVLQAGFGGTPDVRRIVADQRRVLAWHNAPRWWLGGDRRPPVYFRRYVEDLRRLFDALHQVTGSTTFVDATKWPSSPVGLGQVPGIDPVVVHLVRDPRAVVHSWKRQKPLTDREEGAEFPRWGVAHSSFSWLARNLGAEAMYGRCDPHHRIRVRYEDFVTDPRGVLRDIASVAGLEDQAMSFVAGRRIEMGPNHTVGGNVNRLESGPVELRADDAWQRDQSSVDRVGTTILTSPLLGRYGYPLRPLAD